MRCSPQKMIPGLVALLLTSPFAARAEDTGVSFGIHHQYEAPRPLGMGDAFVAVANDYNALFYNPAGLARREDGELNLAIDAGLSPSAQKIYGSIKDAQNSDGNDSAKQQAMFDTVQAQYGKSFGVRTMPLSGVLVKPRWGVAFIPADVTVNGTFHQDVGPSVNTTAYVDTTLAVGYGDDIKYFSNGRLSWGVTGKFINRGYFSKSVNYLELVADSNLVSNSDLREGYGIDGDLGFLYTPNIPDSGLFSAFSLARPTFGLVVRNLAQANFGKSLHLLNKDRDQLTDPPEKLYRVIDVGSRWEYPSAWIFSGRGVMDFRDLMHPNVSLRKSLHLGFEFDWTVRNWWRGAYRVGLNEGFFTAGLSAKFACFNLDLVTYGEDIGTYSTPKENRLYSTRLNLNW